MMQKKLTPKQEIFVAEYLKDLNATQAAIRAGYSEHTAAVIGQENLTKPYISEMITKAKAERASETKIDAAWVLKKAAKAVEIFEEDRNPAMVSALNLVGKHVDVDAFGAEKHQHQNPDGTGIFTGLNVRFQE
jgi:phage terminase small subunit